jgi:hypothetical protein
VPLLAYNSILRQFITCLVPRVVEAPGQEAQEDVSATLGQQLQLVPVLVGVCLSVEDDVQSRLRGVGPTQKQTVVKIFPVKMVSGHKGKDNTHEEILKEVGLLTLEERRMVQTYKIVTGKDMVNSETWFKSVIVTGRANRSAAEPLNPRPQACKLEIRRNFLLSELLTLGTIYLTP